MVDLAYAAGAASDSLAGYLLIVAVTSSFPLASRFAEDRLLPRWHHHHRRHRHHRGRPLVVHPAVPDLREFRPAASLLSYLASYPVLAAYRSIPPGSTLGSIALALALAGLLAFVVGPAIVERGLGGLGGARGGGGGGAAKAGVENGGALPPDHDDNHDDRAAAAPVIDVGAAQDPHHPPKLVEEEEEQETKAQPTTLQPTSSLQPTNFQLTTAFQRGGGMPRSESVESDDVRFDSKEREIKRSSIMSSSSHSDSSGGGKPPKGRAGGWGGASSNSKSNSRESDGNSIDSRSLIDSANAPIFGVDSQGRVNVWNKCAMRIVGYTPEEVMGKNLVRQFITKDYQASVGMVIDRALRGDETANYEFPLMTKEGARIEILLNATARRNRDGKIIGVVGIGQDITGRIAQEREYTRLIDTANAPIFGVDTHCAVNIWNKAAIQLVGYSTEEVMGKNLVTEFITDKFMADVQSVLDQALQGEETANFQFPLMTKSGARLEVLLNATTRRDEQGNIIGVVGIGQDITGRLAQEREYTRLIDTANAPIFGVNTLGRVNVWNKCASRLIGYSADEVMGRSLVQEFITNDYQASVQAVLDKALAGDETDNFEFPLITKAGAHIEVLLNATTRRDEQGTVIGVVGIGQDITARLAQEREYSKLIDTANAPIFGVDTQGAVNVWNQCAMRLVGYSTEEVMGKNLVKEFITDDFKTAVQAVLDQALQGEETANFEFPLMTKGGVRLDVLLNATTRRDEQGNIIGVVGIGQDITGRLAQEREYSRLIDTANAPIFGVDTLGRVNVWNKCASRLIGYSTEEVMGRSLVQDFITDDFKTPVQTVLDQALAGDETDNFEFPLITKSGHRMEVLLNATSRRDEQGNVIGMVGIGQDITARLSQEREYSKLIDTANAPIFGVDTHGAVNVWNQCAMKLVGYSTEEVMGKILVREFITDEFKTAVQAVLDQALHGEETANFEFPLMTKGGVRLDVLLNATTRRDEQGNIIGVVGIGQDITGRLAQEREYSRLIDTANAPIFGVDTFGCVNVWNECASRLIGYSTKEVMGRSLVQDFITDDFKTTVQTVLDQALAGDEKDNFEFPLITKSGYRIEVLLNATSRRDEQGNVIGMVGIGQDITARLSQEREYSKLIDTANAPIFGVDTHGAVNVWNKNAQKLVGYTPEEVMGKNLVTEFITDEFMADVQAVLDQALQGEETANFQFPLMTKSGARLEVLLNATTRRDEQGNIIGVVGIGQDITGRLAQEREYSRLIDTANAPIFGVDTFGRVNVWNKCASRLIGYSADEVMGRSLVQDFITDDFKTPVQTVLDQALAGDETDNFEFPLITKSGYRMEVLLNATSRRDEQGNVIGMVGIGQDITARLSQEREYSKLIDTANAPIFGVDTKGAVNVWNQCAMKLVGYSTEEVIGKILVKEFITDEFKTAVQAVLDQALHGEETANFQFPLMTKGGVRLDVLLNATTRRDEQGNIIGVVGIGQDITGRLAQEREYTRLIDTANAPIFGVDTFSSVNMWNECASRLIGYSTLEIMGRSLVQDFITDDFKTPVQTVLDQALAGDETANFEFPLITKSGYRIEVLLNATSRRDEQGNVIGMVGIGQDITARLSQEREYSKLIDTANAPIFGVDTQGAVNVWNQCAMRLVGYSAEEVMGKILVKEFITDEYKTAVQAVLDQALHGEETANFEFPLMTKGGVRLDVLLNATTRRDEQGNISGVVGIGQDITGRLAQEREYSRLIDTANAPIFGVDTFGCVNVWNKSASRLIGYSTEEVMGRSLVQDFITDDFKIPVQTVLDKALAGDETDNFEFPLITKSKARIEVLLNATTRRDEQGNVIGVVGIGQDITDRLAQEREYSKLIDTANAPIFGVDTQGAVNVWNKNAQKLVGYTPKEVMGKILVKEFITDEFKTAVQAVLDQALHGEETANFEFPLMTKGGVRLDVLLNATTRRDAQGNIIGVVGIGQDITGRLAQEREYTRLIDTANAPIFGVDTLGRVNVWNKCAMRLIGYSTEEVMGHSLVQEFITNDYQASVQAVLDEALTGAETENFEFPLITKAGAHIEVLLNATTRRDSEGNIIGVVGIGQDITARLAQEREYSKLIDTANAPIFGVDTQGAVNVWNQCAMRLVGYSSEEVMGKILVKEFITDEFKTAVQAVLDQALNGEETANFEFPLMTKGGVRLDVLLNATTRRDEQGNISGVVGIGQDITGRLAQEREYSRLIDTANAPIFGVDTFGRVNVWNKSASRLIGYSTEEVMERSLVQDFITDDFKTPVQTVLDKALAGDETDNFEFPLITKSGARIELLLNATTRRDEQGNVIGVVGIGQDISARLAQEVEYSKLIDTANAPIFGVDTLGAVNVWNQCAMRLVGYSTEEVMGHSLVREFITQDYQASVQAVLDKALAGVETANFEFPLITKAGSRIEVLLNATTRRNEHGNVIGVVGIGQDITARLTQEREYSKLIDNANAPIFGVDTQGRVNVWNKCARKLVGYTLAEAMGQNLVEEFITKEYKDAVSTVLDKALRGEETANFEFPLITKHGVRIEVLLNASTRRDEQGNVIGVVGIGQDITGRIAQEREYSKLIDSANAPIFGVDTNGCVNVWNICARNLVGYSTEEVMGHSLVQEFITKDYQASVQAVLDRALDGVETANFEFPLITKAGARIEVLLNATTRRNEHGKVIGVVGIGQDITGRIAQEREYAKLIDTANAPIFGVDAAGKVNVWNKCARALVGYTPEEVMGKNLVKEFITDEFKTAVQAVLDQALHGDETANFEFPLMTKGGVRLEVLLNATTRRDEQGNIIGVVGIGQDITGRIAQEREYSKLIDSANAPIFGVDTHGKVTIWNKNAQKLVGYPSREVMGRNLVEHFITPEHRARVQSVIDQALEGEETANFEFPLMTKAGIRLEVLLNATTRRDEQGNVIGVVGIGQDITGRLAQEREYTRLIDTANAPIFGVDTQGRVNVWNKCAMRLTGYPAEEVMGHSLVKEFIRKEHQEKVQDVIDQTFHGEETANFDFPLTTKGGYRIEILLNATTRRNEHGTIIGMVGIGQDITERIAQEREFSKLIDSANAPIFGVDTLGRVNVWNQCVSSLTGFSMLEVHGRNLVEDFVRDDYKDSVTEILKNALKGIETANFEFPLLTSGDHVVEVLLNATSRRDAQDNVIGVVGIGQDITDARAKRDAEMKQRAAEAATAAQATISAHVYHEIRNVVGSVLALADRATEAVDLALIEDSGENGLRELPTRVRELTDHQRLVCQHAVDTLNDMLDVAKMENGTYTPKHEVIDIGELCRKAAALQSPRMRPRVILELNVPPPNTSFVISDSVLLLQYLSNLLSNAAKFTAAGGVVLVCIVREAGPNWLDVTLGVADSGPGIAKESQRHVLRAFTTGDALPQEDTIGGTKSTGIGLRLADLIAHTITEPSLKPRQDGPIVRVGVEGGTLGESSLQLVKNGEVGLKITSPLDGQHEHCVPNGGPGAFIYFQSAILRASDGAIARHRENPSGEPYQEIDFGAYVYDVDFSGMMKVLVIDDQRTMRQMVAMIYQKIAVDYPGVTIDCYTALSGEQAIRMCREHRFHIITMDQQMSVDYCQSLSDEISMSQMPDEEIPKFVRFGSDKIANAKMRQAYFKNDKWMHDIQPGDGALPGHEAIRKIRSEFIEEKRPPILIFNLTGNILEADRLLFLEVGSSGMLPKPTKLEDFMNLLKKNLGLYISQGMLQLDETRIVMDGGAFRIGVRYLRDAVEPEPITTDRGKLTGNWAGGAIQRTAGS